MEQSPVSSGFVGELRPSQPTRVELGRIQHNEHPACLPLAPCRTRSHALVRCCYWTGSSLALQQRNPFDHSKRANGRELASSPQRRLPARPAHPSTNNRFFRFGDLRLG